MSRRKRASMREGPLADLFRSTADDAPADPPEAPRYGREDPAEAKKARDEDTPAAGPVAEDDSSSSQAAGEEPSPTPPAAEAPAAQGSGAAAASSPGESDEGAQRRLYDQDPKGRSSPSRRNALRNG